MTITQKLIGLLLMAASCLSLGYILARLTTNSSTKTETVSQDHTKTTIITVKKPDGSSTTTETIDSKLKTKTDTLTQIPTVNKPRVNISAIIAEDLKNKTVPAYGLSFTKEFIGPITLGAFGLTNGTIGLSIGVNF